MRYLYGDSTDSPFTSNVLEFLRDAIDFSVVVLESDERIRSGRNRIDALRRHAQQELQEVAMLRKAVADAIEATPKGSADSAAALCAPAMSSACDDVVRSVTESVHARLGKENAQVESEETSEREACFGALMKLCGTKGPPDSDCMLRVRLTDAGRYEAWVDGGCAALGLSWRSEAGLPQGRFEQPLRVDRLQHGLDVQAPELTGWIRKEIKVRPQHLERYTITEIDRDGQKIVVRLRSEPGAADGFDLACDLATNSIAASRVGDDTSAGPFHVEDSDAPKLIALAESVQKSLNEVECTRLTSATLGELDYRDLPTFVEIVERLVAQLAPMIHEIARHSLDPDELVLRWKLSNDRREEIFVSKSTLREKYRHLPNELKTLFEPLGLRASSRRSPASVPPPPEEGTTRTALPASQWPAAPPVEG